MTVGPDSRYQEADRVFTRTHTYDAKRRVELTPEGDPLLTVRDTLYRTVVSNTPDKEIPDQIMARDGDTFQLLATRMFGDPKMWWVLAEANPQIRHPFDLKMGDVLVVPE